MKLLVASIAWSFLCWWLIESAVPRFTGESAATTIALVCLTSILKQLVKHEPARSA